MKICFKMWEAWWDFQNLLLGLWVKPEEKNWQHLIASEGMLLTPRGSDLGALLLPRSAYSRFPVCTWQVQVQEELRVMLISIILFHSLWFYNEKQYCEPKLQIQDR